MLELLLVSPLGESQIISGRLRGLWGQFSPAAGLLLAVWAYCSSFLPKGSGAGVFVFYAATFLSVPVFGLYYSLRCRNFLTAFLSTIAVGLLLPLFLAAAALMACWLAYVGSTPFFSWDCGRLCRRRFARSLLAVCCWGWLYRRLKKRAFLWRTAG